MSWKPKKPKRPRIVSEPSPCAGCRGKGRRRKTTEYYESEWVTCNACNGVGSIPATRINTEASLAYAAAMTAYDRNLADYKTLRTLRLTEEQLTALERLGFAEYRKRHHKRRRSRA